MHTTTVTVTIVTPEEPIHPHLTDDLIAQAVDVVEAVVGANGKVDEFRVTVAAS